MAGKRQRVAIFMIFFFPKGREAGKKGIDNLAPIGLLKIGSIDKKKLGVVSTES